MAKSKSPFQSITTSGAILPPDVLQKIAALGVKGTSPESYHLPPGSKLNEAIAQSWSVVQAHWKSFTVAREELSDDDTGTTITNERWLLPLFKELEYGRLTTTDAPEIDEKTYSIRRFYNNSPIHLIGCNLPLDRRTKGAAGAATASPHAMVQEFLNRSEDHLWAFLSNGLQLRILRDNISLSRQAFVEFDLAAMMDGEIYADFALLWLLCHQSRVEAERQEDCWLEQWSNLAREAGTRVLNDLRNGVAKSIEALGAGFIGHPRNDQLRAQLQESGELSKDDFYRQLLRIVYRLLFLFVAEDRALLHPEDADEAACELYDTHYSTRRLRDLSEKLRGSKHSDLWHSLSLVFSRLEADGCEQLGLIGLGSFLWRNDSTVDLLGPSQVSGQALAAGESPDDSTVPTDPVLVTNDDLLSAIRALAYVEQDKVLRPVDYRNLGSEELGSVYESLLELHPDIHVEAKQFELRTAAGNERKTTGSYYTPDSLVQCLLDSALDPVVADRLKEAKAAARQKLPLPNGNGDGAAAPYAAHAEHAILSMKVCDPACGSGHFLIAAAHRLARRLAEIRTGETEASPADYQHALRDVIGRCIYGVDINPMAVELCKVSLWMEAIEPGRPLSFLDHHILGGNSLLGSTPALLAEGIPDDAFKPIEGDVKTMCTELKKDNKKQRKDRAAGQGMLFDPPFKLGNLPMEFARLSSRTSESVNDVAEKEEMYARLVSGADYQNARLLADTWCAVFVWKKDESDLGRLCPTENDFRRIENSPHSILPHVRSEVRRLADQYQFFHWHLAFPDVFRLPEDKNAENEQMGWNSGFDVVLGNPPWERIKLQEKEWFAERSPEIAGARNAAARRHMISELEDYDPELLEQFLTDRRIAEAVSHVVRDSSNIDDTGSRSGLFPFCGRGDVNTYSLFTELNRNLIELRGCIGCIIPAGIATDDTTKVFFQDLINTQALHQLHGFENEEFLFPGVHHSTKFCLITIGGKLAPRLEADFIFFARRISDLTEPNRHFTLSARDLRLLNPNTLTCPVFRWRRDAEISKSIYRRIPVLIREGAEEQNPWDARFLRMLDLSNDSHLFQSKEQLLRDGWTHSGNTFEENGNRNIPLYEAKMLHHFDHRFSTYECQTAAQANQGKLPELTDAEHACANRVVQPRYWVSSQIPDDSLDGKWRSRWFLGWRDIGRNTDQRTLITTILPLVAAGHTLPILLPGEEYERHTAPLLANMASFATDYCGRQKIGGTHLTYNYIKQFPIVPPSTYAEACRWSLNASLTRWITQRVLELTYTAWDLEAFALDCGYDGPPFRWDEERRFLLRCELDAAYFHLYLGAAEAWGADNAELREMFPTPRDAVDYIMETFPIVKRKDIKRTAVLNDVGEITTEGTYITKDTILSIYDEMQTAIDTGQPYQTRLDPPAGPPTDDDGIFRALSDWDTSHWPCHVHQPRSLQAEASK